MKNEIIIANVLICISILPSVLSVFFALLGIRSYVSFAAYFLALIFIVKLKEGTRKINKDIWSLMLYLSVFLLSITYTISTKTSIEKCIGVFTTIIVPVFLILYCYRFKFDESILEICFLEKVKKYSSYILIFLAVLLIFGFVEKGDDFEGRDTIIGMANAIWCSRYAGFLAVLLVVIYYRSKKLDIFNIVGLLAAVFIMIRSGSRGPILSLVVSILIFMFPQIKLRQKLLLIALTILIYQMFVYFSPRDFYAGIDDSNGRFEMMGQAIELKYDLQTILLGLGIGSFGLAFYGEDTLVYPHNIIVETFAEIGTLGVSLLLVLLFVLFKKRRVDGVFDILCLYFFVNSQFSGDIAGNNYFFIFASIILLSKRIMKYNNVQIY